ncbi:zinc finger protein 195-like [Sitophilus oryzae]|uniref:Zinc finger protein 195-like n=1 Tax=Sitophilus oryzae TaxID=7048 RepID=A0A6J2YDU1_SITOR|nr:zinc finger protein 195-like [Sitophilus oryzae]XP_030761345.1 zinc finger protein 195-like [Sitophilus oryzae]
MDTKDTNAVRAYELCYTCLSNKNLVCVPKDHKEYEDFVELFYKFTNLYITENVITICENCIFKLNESHQFRTVCIESYKTFKTLTEEFINETSIDPTTEDKNQENIEPANTIESSETNPRENIENTWNVGYETICGICKKQFSSVLELRTHFTSHEENNELESTESNEDLCFNYVCSKCNTKFSVLGDIKLHIDQHNNESLKSIPSKTREMHEDYQNFENEHYRVNYTSSKPYECLYCPNTYGRLCDLKVHTRIHTGEKPYKCTVCDKHFRRKTHLTIHMRIHTGEKPYSCKTCGKSFAQSGDVTTHERTHTGEKPFVCNVCNKCFAQRPSLKTHLKKHFLLS